MQRHAQQPVLEHQPERTLGRIGVEIEPSDQPVADGDMVDGATPPLEMRADADGLQHMPRRARHRRGAPVRSRRQHGRRLGRIDDDAGQPMGIERDSEGKADKASAQDDDIGFRRAFTHGAALSQRRATCHLLGARA